jgi:hypothetical protein
MPDRIGLGFSSSDLHTTRAVAVFLYGGTSIGFGIRPKQDDRAVSIFLPRVRLT